MTVGGVDTYYDYDEQQWKSRRLGGGPIRTGPVCPLPRQEPAQLADGEWRAQVEAMAAAGAPDTPNSTGLA